MSGSPKQPPTLTQAEIPKPPVELSAVPTLSSMNQDLFDRTLVLLLEREETLLGDIITQCRNLIQSTENQVHEVAEFLDDEM